MHVIIGMFLVNYSIATLRVLWSSKRSRALCGNVLWSSGQTTKGKCSSAGTAHVVRAHGFGCPMYAHAQVEIWKGVPQTYQSY